MMEPDDVADAVVYVLSTPPHVQVTLFFSPYINYTHLPGSVIEQLSK